MKYILIFLSSFLFFVQVSAQSETLLTIDNKSISEGEFMRIYQKNNNTGNVIDKKTVSEYLELFINFKLKVAEAENLGMDTLNKFIEELNGYKTQLEKPYFTDKRVDENLIQEAFERQQYDIRASHILIMVGKDANPNDTLLAYNKINSIRNQAIKGKKSFSDLAKQHSEDPSAKQNAGDLGYFTVFQMVYPFENAAYNTKLGDVSEIVRTRYGYHILNVVDKRESQGEVLVAHIMIASSKKSDPESLKAAENKIKMIYSKLEKGENFKSLAQLYSEDKGSAKKGGLLQWFGTGRMVPAFEKTAYALKDKEEFSKPIKTDFGWHIIQLIDKRNPKEFEENEKYLKNRVKKDMRGMSGETAVLNRIKVENNYSLNQKSLNDFYKIDQSVFSGKWTMPLAKTFNKTLMNLGDSVYTQKAFVQFIKKNTKQKRNENSINELVDKLYKLFLEAELKRVERSHLADKHPEYKYLLQEYHDGILLFDLTDKEVWSKAIQDSLGLVNFYEKNKTNYVWGQRVEAHVYSAKDSKVIAKLKKLMKKGSSKEKILSTLNKKDSTAVEFINEDIYSKEDYKIVDNANLKLSFFEQKDIKAPLFYENDNKLVYVSKILAPQNKLLEEAKGQITADYQDFLEKEWVEALRKKYTVVINEKLWSEIKKSK